MAKSLHNTDSNGAHQNVPDIQTFGDPDVWQLICKASSEEEGWMKSTKAMEVKGEGCLVQVTTQQRNPNGSYSVAEALAFVPRSQILTNKEGIRTIGIQEILSEVLPTLEQVKQMALNLCYMIEDLEASTEQTQLSIQASKLHKAIEEFESTD